MSSTDHAARRGAMTRETIMATLSEYYPEPLRSAALEHETGRSAPAVVKQLRKLIDEGLVAKVGTLGPGVRYTLGPATEEEG